MSTDATWQVGQYLVGDVIRRGGMSMVFKAYQPALDRYVALKVLPFTDDPTVVARFKLEARAIAQLEHPNVVPIYEYGEHDGHLYIAMQYVAGGRSLVDAIDGAIEPTRAIRLIVGVLTGLGFAHEHGIVHRDVKPANVLLPYPVWPMLTDFGVAKVVTGPQGRRLTREGLIIGTPAYMAPEQAFALPVDGRTDIYAAGVVLYEMLTGSVPFVAQSPAEALQMHAYEPAPAPSTRKPGLDPRLDDVVLRALAKDPAARYQCAADMVDALEALLHSADADAAPGEREVERDLFELGVQAFRDGRWEDAIGHLGQLAATEPANEDVEALLEVALREHEAAGAAIGASDNDAAQDPVVRAVARGDGDAIPGAGQASGAGSSGGWANDTLPGLALAATAPPPPGESQLLEPLRPPTAPTLAARALPDPPAAAQPPAPAAPPAAPVPRPPTPASPSAPGVTPAVVPPAVVPSAVVPPAVAPPPGPPPTPILPMPAPLPTPASLPAPVVPVAPSLPQPQPAPVAPPPAARPAADVTAALPVRAPRGARVPFVPVAPAAGLPTAAPAAPPEAATWVPTAPPVPPPLGGPPGGDGATGAVRRRRWPWGVAALAAVVVVVVAAIAIGGGSDDPGTGGPATTGAAPTTADVTSSQASEPTTTQGPGPSTTTETTGTTTPLPASVPPVFEQALGLAATDVASVHAAAVVDATGDQQDSTTGAARPDVDPATDIVASGRFVLSLDDAAVAGATARWPEIPGLLVVPGDAPLGAGDYAVVWERHAAAVVTDASAEVISILRIDRPDVPDVDPGGVVDAGPFLGDYWIVLGCGPDPCAVRSIVPTSEFRSGTTGAHVLVHGDLVAFVVPIAEASGDTVLESSSRPRGDGTAAAVFDLATTPGAQTVTRYAPAP
jgi:hypothetical protein